MNIKDLRLSSNKGTELIRNAVHRVDFGYSEQSDNALKDILEPLTRVDVKLAIYECLHNNASADQILESILETAYGR